MTSSVAEHEALELQPSTQHSEYDARAMNDHFVGDSSMVHVDKTELNSRTVRKLDFVLLPFLALLFLFNSLDKSNIGNAETANFTGDIGLEPRDLNDAVAVFFACFVILQPVGAALGRKFGMKTFVPACMTIWGICTALHVWVRAKWQLVVLRMMIGCLEAGFYPVTVSYISLFYTRFEFARRLSAFYGQLAIAGAFGGVLSYFVFSRFSDHPDSKWKPWQVLFIIEGVATIILAMIGFLWLPTGPRTAWFLSASERRWAEERIKRDRDIQDPSESTKSDEAISNGEDGDVVASAADEAHERLLSGSTRHTVDSRFATNTAVTSQGLTRTDVLSAVLDWKIWYLLGCNILSAIPVTAFSVFLPLVLAPLTSPSQPGAQDPDTKGSISADVKNPAIVNLLSAPPFLLGAINLYAFSIYSDRHRVRFRPILVGLGILITGLLLIICLPKAWVIARYVSLCIMLSGAFVPSPLTVSWMAGNTPAPGKRAIVLGLNGWGNIAGVIASAIFEPKYAKQGYKTSLFWTLMAVIVAGAGFVVFRILLLRENRTRETWCRKVERREVDLELKGGTGKWPGRGILGWDLDRIPILNYLDDWVMAQKQNDGIDGRVGDERFTFRYGI